MDPLRAGQAAVEERMLSQAESVGELIEQFRDRIPSEMIDGPGWSALLERTRTLPISLATNGFGFEWPLHTREAAGDLGLGMYGGSRSLAHFEEWYRSQPRDPLAAAAIRLLRESEEDESTLGRMLQSKIVFEYDIGAASHGEFPAPGLFVYPEEGTLTAPCSARAGSVFRHLIDTTVTATGRIPDPTEREYGERLLFAMPPGTKMATLGVFPSRPRAVRLAVEGFRETSSLVGFLKDIGWPGNPEATVPLLSDLEAHDAFGHLCAHLDVHPRGIGRTLGVSFYTKGASWLVGGDAWLKVIDRLTHWGLAVPEKTTPLKALSGAEPVLGRQGMIVVMKGIHHLKAVMHGDRFEQAKAYAYYGMFPPTVYENAWMAAMAKRK